MLEWPSQELPIESDFEMLNWPSNLRLFGIYNISKLIIGPWMIKSDPIALIRSRNMNGLQDLVL